SAALYAPWSSAWRRPTIPLSHTTATIQPPHRPRRPAPPPTDGAPAASPSVTPLRLVDNRAVDQRAQLAANRVGGGRPHLRHEHHGEVLGGRDPERRGGGPAPVVLARDTEPTEHRGVEHARKAEAETHASAAGLTGRGRTHLRQVA